MSPPARPVSRSAGGLGSAGVQHPAHLLTRLHSSDIHSPVSLLSLNGELRSTRSHQKLYRKPYLTVYGNQQWRDKEKLKRPNSAARFLDYMDKEEDDPFRKWKLDYVARLRNQRRSEKQRAKSSTAGAGLHVAFGASLEIRDELKQQFGFAAAHEKSQLSALRRQASTGTKMKKPKRTSEIRADVAFVAARQNEMIFEIAASGDFQLSFAEFKKMVNTRLRHDKPDSVLHDRKLRQWFKALDADGNGQIDPAEFFAFALREAIIRSDLEVGGDAPGEAGGAFASMFQQGLSGVKEHERMDCETFCELTNKLGFGAMGEIIFEEFLKASGNDDDDDDTNDGTINVKELLSIVHDRTADLKPLLVGWARQSSAENKRSRERRSADAAQFARRPSQLNEGLQSLDRDDNGQLDLDEVGVPALLRTLREHLQESGMDAQAFFRHLDVNGTWTVTETELRFGLDQLGFPFSRELATALFDELDTDANYRLNFSEVAAWMRKRDRGWERMKAWKHVMKAVGLGSGKAHSSNQSGHASTRFDVSDVLVATTQESVSLSSAAKAKMAVHQNDEEAQVQAFVRASVRRSIERASELAALPPPLEHREPVFMASGVSEHTTITKADVQPQVVPDDAAAVDVEASAVESFVRGIVRRAISREPAEARADETGAVTPD